jgi:hypothetical protein
VEGKIFSVEILEGVGPSVQRNIFLVEKLEGGLPRQAATITSLVAIRVFTTKVTVLADCPSLLWENSFQKILWENWYAPFWMSPDHG